MAQTRTDMVAPGPMPAVELQERLSLGNYLALLETDPDDAGALAGLKRIAQERDLARLGSEPQRLLESARQGHEARGEFATVARLIEVELELIDDDPLFAASLWKELGRLRSEYLLESDAAREAYTRALEKKPDDAEVTDALKRLEQAETSWKKFAKRFVDEAESAADLSLKTSLLLRAAGLAWENRKNAKAKEADRLFEKVLEIDRGNLRAIMLFEHTLREREEWAELARHLSDSVQAVSDKQDGHNLSLRAARVFARKLNDHVRAADCYRHVLETEPGNAEAMLFLTDRFTEGERWDELVALYENALKVPHKLDVEQGMLVQLGMVHFRMRHKPEDAEPYFGRLRKLDPTHPAMLDFYRSHLKAQGDQERLLRVLTDAQRIASEPARRVELAVEAARIAQAQHSGGAGERAIEAWKNVQRLDPQHPEAARVLKELYAKSEKWNALCEVLKGQIDAAREDDAAARDRKLELLRELAAVYRDKLRLDGMLINAYNTILRIAPGDRGALEALADKYRELGRWNDLINVLISDADASADRDHRIAIYLKVAGLWLEHFSNYNQASAPLEKVLELEPGNRSALSMLREIYEKKRAWKQLFEVLKKERDVSADAEQRAALTMQLATLAAERLHRYDEAVALWREVAQAKSPEGGGSAAALDAIEKLAEREKDWKTLAGVLDQRAEQGATSEERVRILLKLGGVYADRLADPVAASAVFRRVLAIDPKQGRALRSLRDTLVAAGEWDEVEQLYERAGDFEGLVDVLSSEADRTTERAAKVSLSLRVARIFEQRIGVPERAQRSYERVLSVEPEHAAAARALAPLYEREEKWSRLYAMLEIVVRALSPDAREERLALLTRLASLAQDKLRDAGLAFGHSLAAFHLAPERGSTREALERSAEIAQAFDKVVEAYIARAESAPVRVSTEENIELRRRVALIATIRLGRLDLAAAQWELVLAAVPDDSGALTALDRIYRSEQRSSDVRKLLLHKLRLAEEAGDATARWELRKELAELEEEQLQDPVAAAEHYRAMAELQPDDADVWAALDRLALAGERYDELTHVLEWRLNLAEDKLAKVELGARLGSLWLERIPEPEPDKALAVLSDVVELDPAHGASLALLEKLGADEPAYTAQLQPVLERAYERSGRFDKLATLLQARVSTTRDEVELRRLRLRLAEISGGQLGDALGAYASLEAAFLQEPEDTSLWDRVAEAAEQAGQQRALASAYAQVVDRESLTVADRIELASRIARIYEEVLSEPLEAEPFHRRVLVHDPLDEPAFVALKELYTNQERWEDLQALYRRRIDDAVDADVKLDLLLQICFLFEEILEQPDKAAAAYRSVLELIPDHAPSRRALEGLYEKLERHRDLALLLRSNLDHAEGYDQIDTLHRLGELHEQKLGEPAQAVDHYEQVLALSPNHLRAQAALGRLLAVDSLRQRVAAILEPTYESQGAWADLVRVLEILLADRSDKADRAELLFRIGGLQEARLRDTEGAFSAYSRSVLEDPGMKSARDALARVSSGRDLLRRKRAQVLEQATLATTDPEVLIELLQELALLSFDELDDKPAAERCYTRLIELASDRDDIVLMASRQLERIHLQSNDFAGLARDLSRQVALEFDPAIGEQLLVRLADLHEQRLEDPSAAIEAHRKRLELDPNNLDALSSLERVYTATQSWEELVDVLSRRGLLEQDEVLRRELARRGARVLEEKISDPIRAIEAHREVSASFGPDRETLLALSRLYESLGRNTDLLETLEAEIEFSATPTERAALRFRIAELLREKLAEPERAIGAYVAALEDEPDHAASLGALDAIMQDESSPFRREAARAAAPRYEQLQRFDKLLAVLDLLAETDDEFERGNALAQAAEVAESGLHDPVLAMAHVGRALRVSALHDRLPELLADYARLAEVTGRYAEYVEGLRAIVGELSDPDQRVRVQRDIALAAQDKLHDAALARATYRQILEEDGEDSQALDALLRLDEEAADYPALIDVLTRKIALTGESRPRMRLLEKQADVYERGLGDADHAIAALEEVIAEEPSATAYASLERLYLRVHRYSDLAALYEQQLERKLGNAVDLRYRLANSLRQHGGDTFAALNQLREALTADPTHADSIGLGEAIMSEHGEHRALAAEILEPGYLARREWQKLTAALRARVDAETDAAERMRLLVRLARIYEEQLEDFDETMEIYARLFREDVRDEDVWDRLGRLAKVGGQWTRLATILSEPLRQAPVEDDVMAKLARHVGQLYDEKSNDLAEAAEFYAQALTFDPTDVWSFRALESAYMRAGNHAALLELYTRQAEIAAADSERVALLHKRARLYKGELKQPDKAIETYREILESTPADQPAISSLEALLFEGRDFAGLAEHLRWRIDHAGSNTPKEELELKHRLGALLLSELKDEPAAIDLFEQVLQSDPKHQATLSALEQIVQEEKHRLRVTEVLEPVYRQLDQWKKLVAIHEARLELLEDPIEKRRLLCEIGELHERRGNDLGHAFHAYARAFTNEPDNDSVRGQIDRLANKTQAWSDHVAAYEAALAAADEPGTQLMLLTTIARVHDEKRGDPRAAIVAYERFLALEADDPSALDALESLHTMVGDWRGLVGVLERKVVIAYSAEEKAELLRRIGSVYEEFVGDSEAAIDAYRRAASELDSDELALESLDRLYAHAGQALPLFETLKRRIELAQDAALRVELGLRLGFLADTRLHYAEEAIAAYRRVLDDDDANATAISHLSTLFQRLGMWNDLLDNLRTQVHLAGAPDTRVALHCRAGEILLDKLLDPGEAIEAFRRALDEDSQCVPAIDALLSLTVREEHRAEAAAVVEPLLREQGRFDDLVRLITRKIEDLVDPAERRAELVRLAEVEEHGRHNKFAAFEALSRALSGDTPDEFVQEELERLARELSAWSKFYGVLIDRAGKMPDPRDAAAMFRRAGRIAEEEMRDDSRAIEAYKSASAHDDDGEESLVALDRLYEKTQAWEPQVDVLERRVATSVAGPARTELSIRLGYLLDQRCNDPRGAFAAYKEVLDNDPGEPRALSGMELLGQREELVSDVLEVLEHCYREANALEKVVELYELRARIASSSAEKARVLREAAALWERSLNEPGRAFLCMRQAFELDPVDLSQLEELERIAEVCGAFTELCALAERVLAGQGLESSAKRELALRTAAWYRDHGGDLVGEERALRIALMFASDDPEIHARLTDLLRERGDPVALMTALRAFAEIDDDSRRALASLHEAGGLALEAGSSELAEACFGRVLELEPEDAAALSALAELKADQGKHAEAAKLLARWLAVETDSARRKVLHHGLAEIYGLRLGDFEQAAEAYRSLLDEFPDDTRGVAALEGIYERLGRYTELESSLRDRLSRAQSSDELNEVRLRLAKLSEVQLGRPEDAIQTLREVLADAPQHEIAAAEFERLLRGAGQYDELSSWLGQRATDALAASDRDRAQAVLWSLFSLYHNELGDRERAIDALLRLFELEPQLRVAKALVGLYEAEQQFERMAEFLELQVGLEEPEQAMATALQLAELATSRLNDPALTERALRQARRLAPQDPSVLVALRTHLEHSGEYDKLAQLLEEELQGPRSKPEQAGILREIASLYSTRLGRSERGIEYLQRAVTLLPGDRDLLLALCDLYLASGREREAIPVLEQIIASYGGRRAKEVAVFEHRLGRAYEGASQPDEAFKHYDAAFRIDLTSVPVLRDLGRLCLERGDYDRATKTYRALLLQKLGEGAGIQKADVYYYLGEISAKQGDKTKAKAMLERAISEGGQHAKASALLSEL